MPIYGDYGINLHHTQPIAPTLKPFETFAAGLPGSFIDAIYKQPRFAIAYTSGSYLNNYGHALLFCGEAGFIHINAPISLPRFMSINQFNRYLKDERKVLLGMMGAHITQINTLLVALNKMCQQTWTWFAVLHNCLTFTHDVLKAGGYNVEKQEEFRKHILKLPTEHLKSTRERDLILTQQVSIPFHHFDPHALATHLLVNLPILQNFHPDAIEKLIIHLLEHPIAVLKQQAELLAAQDNRPAHEGHIAHARSQILATLEKLAKGLTADYNIIFTDRAQLKRVLENIADVDTVLKNSLARAIIQTKVSHIQSTLFAKAPISFALDSKPTLLMSM